MNDENLKRGNPETQFKTGREQVETARIGGKASGRARREKANLRKLAQQVLDDTYTDKDSGKKFTGSELFIAGLAANLSNPNSKNWGKAIDVLIMLTGAKYSKEDIDMIKAQAELIKAKAQAINSGGAGIDIEDLQPLAEMLKHDKNTDDTVETVLEET